MYFEEKGEPAALLEKKKRKEGTKHWRRVGLTANIFPWEKKKEGGKKNPFDFFWVFLTKKGKGKEIGQKEKEGEEDAI